ncbi:MAG: ATP-binding protein [Coriobacteriaceae bacterium]|nr:ATP-binding protein [Coriobacteriaceae bacterium]
MGDTGLHGFIDEVLGEGHLRVEEELGGGFVRLRTSEAERRQAQQDIRCVEDIVLELLRNARDAGARMICIATNRDGRMRNIVVIDDGEGIPPQMWQKVFEPRVTSKLDTFHADQWGVHGRGMALYSIACNAAEHRIAASGEGLGTSVAVSADTGNLPEKADQSTVPHLVVDATGRSVMRGPRNINRIVTEFTLAQRGSCAVYLGSPTEVLATLLAYGSRVLSAVERAFAPDAGAFPVCLRPALAATPEELAQTAHELGLELSTRSARRVMDGEIAPLEPFANAISLAGGKRAVAAHSRRPERRAVHIAPDDRVAFAQRVGAAYGPLAEAYYLDAQVQPEITVRRDGIRVFIPFAEQQGAADGEEVQGGMA